jgi:peroxiredoxin
VLKSRICGALPWRAPDPGYRPRMLKPGDVAPDFDVPAHDGSRVHLAELAGQRVLLWFYPAADTPG